MRAQYLYTHTALPEATAVLLRAYLLIRIHAALPHEYSKNEYYCRLHLLVAFAATVLRVYEYEHSYSYARIRVGALLGRPKQTFKIQSYNLDDNITIEINEPPRCHAEERPTNRSQRVHK